MKRNKEYGIISDDFNLVQTANNDFNQMCKDEIAGKNKDKNLKDIKQIIDSFPKDVNIELPKYELECDEVYS